MMLNNSVNITVSQGQKQEDAVACKKNKLYSKAAVGLPKMEESKSLFMTIPNSSAVSKERNAVTKSKSLSRLRSSIDVNGLEIVAVSPAKSPKPYKSFSRSCPSLVGGNYEECVLGPLPRWPWKGSVEFNARITIIGGIDLSSALSRPKTKRFSISFGAIAWSDNGPWVGRIQAIADCSEGDWAFGQTTQLQLLIQHGHDQQLSVGKLFVARPCFDLGREDGRIVFRQKHYHRTASINNCSSWSFRRLTHALQIPLAQVGNRMTPLFRICGDLRIVFSFKQHLSGRGTSALPTSILDEQMEVTNEHIFRQTQREEQQSLKRSDGRLRSFPYAQINF